MLITAAALVLSVVILLKANSIFAQARAVLEFAVSVLEKEGEQGNEKN